MDCNSLGCQQNSLKLLGYKTKDNQSAFHSSFFFANYVATRQTERLPERKNEMPKPIKITYIIEILCTIKAVCLPYMISKFSKAFAGYVVRKGGLISEGIFNLVPTSKECVKSLSINISIQVEKSLGTKLKIPSEIKLPLSKRGHCFLMRRKISVAQLTHINRRKLDLIG